MEGNIQCLDLSFNAISEDVKSVPTALTLVGQIISHKVLNAKKMITCTFKYATYKKCIAEIRDHGSSKGRS